MIEEKLSFADESAAAVDENIGGLAADPRAVGSRFRLTREENV
jgi:hypothetical protein